MVQVKTDSSIISIRGRSGGVYFKTGKPGQHIQAMPRTVRYTRSALQMVGVGGYSVFSAFWHLALLVFFGAAWAAFAIAYLFTDKRGESKRITGFNWYMHYAMTFPETDEPHFFGPPHAPYDLPDYIVTSGTHWEYYLTPPEWPPQYPGGYFWEGIPWNDKPSYRTDSYEWSIWWKDPFWAVSPSPGFEPPDKTYYSPGPDITDWYLNPVTGKRVHIYVGKRE